MKAGYDQGSLAVRYFLCGIVVVFVRGVITEKITKFLMKRESATKTETI
jgi:PTS system glucitol/sorbitol-specific IIC component